MASKNFRKLKIWQKGISLAVQVYHFSAMLPTEEKFGLVSQLRRAASSVPANIAEGSSRASDKDFRRFLEIALGSLFELDSHVALIQALQFAPESACLALSADIVELQRMTHAFIETLSENIP